MNRGGIGPRPSEHIRRALAIAAAATLFLLALYVHSRARPAHGGADDGEETRERWSRCWERRGQKLSGKHVAFVIDVSGSMRGLSLEAGRGEVMTILSLFSDDGFFKIFAFCDDVKEFRAEWTRLPDEEALVEARDWLGRLPGMGSTALADGVVMALADETAPELAVVVVSDGEPSGLPEEHLERISDANGRRKSPAIIHAIGIFEKAEPTLEGAGSAFLRKMVEAADGSYLRLQRRELSDVR